MLNILSGFLLVLSFYYGWLIVYTHASKFTAFGVGFIAFISYFLGFTIVALIPYDIYLRYTRNEINSPQKHIDVMKPLWFGMYWISFVLGWFVLPMIKEYIDSGNFSFFSKLREALYHFTKSLIFVLGFGLALVLYLLLQKHFILDTLSIFLIVLNNCSGLFMIIILLGFGLVNVPKLFWSYGNTEKYLKDLYVEVKILEEQMWQANQKLDEIKKLVSAVSYQISDDSPLSSYLDIILSRSPIEHFDANRPFISGESKSQLETISEKKLSEINYSLKKAIVELERIKCKYNNLVEEVILMEDIAKAYNSPQKKVSSTMISPKEGSFIKSREIFEWFWLTRARPAAYRFLGVLFAIMSLFIILGEITIWTKKPITVFRLPLERDLGVYWIQVIVFIPLIYIIACIYYALSNIKLGNFYGLYRNNSTDPSNLMWNASIMLKLLTPLSYNFYMFMKFKKCEFYLIMKVWNFVPVLGKDFGMYFPALLVLLCIMNYFNIYEKIIVALRTRQLSFSEKYSGDRALEGAIIIRNEREAREKDLGLNNSFIGETDRYVKIESLDKSQKKNGFNELYN